jgi:hypothetical protein
MVQHTTALYQTRTYGKMQLVVYVDTLDSVDNGVFYRNRGFITIFTRASGSCLE